MQVPWLHVHMANQFQQMKRASEVNSWKYVRMTYPPFCTVHAIALAPTDTIFRFLMVFIDEQCILDEHVSCTAAEFCEEAALFIGTNKLTSKGRLTFPDMVIQEKNLVLKELLRGDHDGDPGYFPIVRVIWLSLVE